MYVLYLVEKVCL